MLLEKLHYLSQGAELVVFAGSLPRGVEDDFYAEAIHDLARAGHPGRARLRGRAAAARRRGRAVPRLAEPARGRGARRPGVPRRRGLRARRSTGSPSSARGTCSITTETGCFALLREEREARRFRAVAPRVEPVSTVGAGDALLGAFLAARSAGRPLEERSAPRSPRARPRRSSSARAASTRRRRAGSSRRSR